MADSQQPRSLKPANPETYGLLAVDVGNSRTKFGLFECAPTDTSSSEFGPILIDAIAVKHDHPLVWDLLRNLASNWPGNVLRAVIAGVNPARIERLIAEWPQELGELKVIRDYRDLGIRVDVDFPDKVGIDRLLNGVAANHWRAAGESVVVIDSGTATTIDLITDDGAFAGGAILPGLELAGRALHQYTALLPQILPEELVLENLPPFPLGKNTRDAIRSGIFWGQVGAVRELAGQMTPTGQRSRLLVTGGGARLLVPHLQDLGVLQFEEHLPLKGLAIVHRSITRAQPPR